MSRWVIETNLGYVEGSLGRNPIRLWFTKDIGEATYRNLEKAKVWAGKIISDSLCGVLYVKLVPLDLPDEPSRKAGE